MTDNRNINYRGWKVPEYLGRASSFICTDTDGKRTQAAHIVIDLETFSLSKNAAIVAIGAAAIDTKLCPCGWFYSTANLQSSISAGMDVDGKTISWWFSQTEAMPFLHINHGPDISVALCCFGKWLDDITTSLNAQFWGCGPEFDIVILENAIQKVLPNKDRFEIPFRMVQSLRTIRYLDMFLASKDDNEPDDTDEVFPKHVALYDAIYEADQLSRVLGKVMSLTNWR